MKTVVLGLILVLQSSGLWQHVPADTRLHLARAATDPAVVASAAPTSNTAAYTPQSLSLPVQLRAAPLQVPAAAALAVDVASGTVLHSQNPLAKRPVASVTKLVTALVILSRHKLDEQITIPKLPAYGPEDERIGLVTGETYTTAELLQALLVQSANDAADALAIADAGSKAKFAARMNAKMAEWGITGTQFNNPSGLTDTGNYATAEALTQIARLSLTNAYLRQIVSQTTATITSGSGRVIAMETTNQLLSTGDFYGIKTGYTLAAGECFVGLTRINGHEIITVVLGADDRFGDTQTLTNWISRNWEWL